MRSDVQIPLRRLAASLLRATGLAALALVLSVHPATGAGEGTSQGLAGLLRALLCGCAECAGEERPLVAAESTCCGHAGETPGRRTSGCEDGGVCTCSHPDQVPVPDDGPLAAPASGSASGDPLVRLALGQDAAERTPCVASGGVLAPTASTLAPPGRLEPVARPAARPASALATSVRLACLSTLLL